MSQPTMPHNTAVPGVLPGTSPGVSPGVSRRVLLTGIRGFTGQYLAQALRASGHQVFGIVQGAAMAPDEIQADLLDQDALSRVVDQVQPEWVVHLAAIAFVAHNDVNAMYRTNVVGTRNLLQALASASVTPTAVLLASSANIYGNTLVHPITEQVLPAPANDYAVSKLAMEYMAKLWFERLPITLVRPFNYTGVGQSENFLLPKIVNHYRRKAKVIELGNLDVARDFSDVRHVVQVYQRLLELALAGETLNICSGQAWSLAQVLDLMSEIAGYTMDVKVNPAFVRANEVKCLVGSNARLLEKMGSHPDSYLNPQPCLQETLRWMWQA